MVLMGFSQGGALALHVALRSSYALGGVVALSTWVPLRDDYPDALSSSMSKVPVLQVPFLHHARKCLNVSVTKALLFVLATW